LNISNGWLTVELVEESFAIIQLQGAAFILSTVSVMGCSGWCRPYVHTSCRLNPL